MPIDHVIIVGGGPSGLLLATLLARHPTESPIRLTVLEKGSELLQSSRAVFYGPASCKTLHRAGVLEDIRSAGYNPEYTRWRSRWSADSKADGGAETFTYPYAMDTGFYRTAALPLNSLGPLLLKHLEVEATKSRGRVTIRFNADVTGVGQDEERSWVTVSTPDGTEKLYADYVVGCDGARSVVRKSLFGEDFPGFTWDTQVIATDVKYNFDKFGYSDINFVCDGPDWYFAARILKAPSELWRVSYGEPVALTEEEVRARQPSRFRDFLPGSPEPDDYEIVNLSPFRVHQRVAPSMRVGRVLLVADAAHLCNPFGGLGLTGGIADLDGLFDCLVGIHEGKADESILDTYSAVRVQKWKEFINPVSTANLKRLMELKPEDAHKDPALMRFEAAAKDPAAKEALTKRVESLEYDFKQHWRST